MRLTLLVLITLFLCGGCAGKLKPTKPLNYPPELIDGTVLFGAPVAVAPAVDLLKVSPQMEAFVDEHIMDSYFGYGRFRRLMTKMVGNGFFINQYDKDATYTAAQTFALRKGNCLAYTNLFVALARQAGLNASYQLIDAQPTWDVASGLLVRNNHVNVRLQRMQVPGFTKNELTVDFNNVQAAPGMRRVAISDAYAESMFYGNLAVDQIQAGNGRAAFAFLKRGIVTEPANTDLWNNLGALYSMNGQYELAQSAYETVMKISKNDRTAVSGLAKSLHRQGKFDEAKAYERLSVKYRRRNPFYHYAVAELAFQNNAFEEAMVAVNQAIKLERGNARFYALRAATAQELGDVALARRSTKLQRKHGAADPVTMVAGALEFD